MSDHSLPAPNRAAARPRRFRSATAESTPARLALIATAILGVAVLIFAPLLTVFAQALAEGLGAALASWRGVSHRWTARHSHQPEQADTQPHG